MKQVLLPVDFSSSLNPVLDSMRALLSSSDTKLWLLHVANPDPEFVGYGPGPQVVRDQVAELFQKEHQRLSDIADGLRQEGYEVVPLMVQGSIVEKISEEIDRLKIDLVVMGSHGHGALYSVLMGSTCEGVMRKSRSPVLVVPIGEK